MTKLENQPKSPTLIVCDDIESTSLKVAEVIAELVRSNPHAVLGLATGGTPIGVYRELVRMHRQDGLDFSQVTSFNLDEYDGLGPDHPQSFRFFMQQHLFNHINIDPRRTHVPDGLAGDADAHARAYEDAIHAAGGIDLQLLGVGDNAHIAFNEPGSPLDSRTRAIELTEETIAANSRFFDSIDQVPRRAITMGIGTILEAKRIVLMATGASKADAIRASLEGDCNPSYPASLLQRHSDVTFVIDQAAAGKLTAVDR